MEKNGKNGTEKTENSEKGPKPPNLLVPPVFGCWRGIAKGLGGDEKKILRKQCGNYAEGRRSSAGRSTLNSAQRMKCGHRSLFTSKHSCLHRGMVSLKVSLPPFWTVLQLGPRSQNPEWFK